MIEQTNNPQQNQTDKSAKEVAEKIRKIPPTPKGLSDLGDDNRHQTEPCSAESDAAEKQASLTENEVIGSLPKTISHLEYFCTCIQRFDDGTKELVEEPTNSICWPSFQTLDGAGALYSLANGAEIERGLCSRGYTMHWFGTVLKIIPQSETEESEIAVLIRDKVYLLDGDIEKQLKELFEDIDKIKSLRSCKRSEFAEAMDKLWFSQ